MLRTRTRRTFDRAHSLVVEAALKYSSSTDVAVLARDGTKIGPSGGSDRVATIGARLAGM